MVVRAWPGHSQVVCLPCAGLQALHLSGCERLSARVLSSLQCAQRLACLDLRKSDWLRDGHMRILCQLTGLRVLSLADCKHLSAGACLQLPRPDVMHASPADANAAALVCGSRSLCNVGPMECSLPRAGVCWLGVLPNLESLNLSGLPHLSDSGLGLLAGAAKLEELVINRCRDLRWRILPPFVSHLHYQQVMMMLLSHVKSYGSLCGAPLHQP